MLLRTLLLAGAPCGCSAAPAAVQTAEVPANQPEAQPNAAARPPATPAPDDNEIVVTGSPRIRADILSGSSVVSGDTLTRDIRSSLGEALARQPGVSATSFGPNASRPAPHSSFLKDFAPLAGRDIRISVRFSF